MTRDERFQRLIELLPGPAQVAIRGEHILPPRPEVDGDLAYRLLDNLAVAHYNAKHGEPGSADQLTAARRRWEGIT